MSTQRGKPRRSNSNRNNRGGKPRSHQIDNVDDPDKFSKEEWDAFLKRTGTLRGWLGDDGSARNIAISIPDGRYGHFHQRRNDMSERILNQSESRKDTSGFSSAVDKGLKANLGGGVPGAQGNIGMGVTSQSDGSKAESESATHDNDSSRGHYIGMTIWLYADKLTLSEDCIDFFNKDWTDAFGGIENNSPATQKDFQEIQKKFQQRLVNFQEDFGVTHYREIQVGVLRQTASSKQRKDFSASVGEGKSRRVDANFGLEGPNVHADVSGHYGVDDHQDGSMSKSTAGRDTVKYSHGGNAVHAYTDGSSWLDSLTHTASWEVLKPLRDKSIPLLQLVNEIAKLEVRRQGLTRTADFSHVQERSQLLLECLQNNRIRERREAIGAACRQQITVTVEVVGKKARITAPHTGAIRDIKISSVDSALRFSKMGEDNIKDAKSRGRFEIFCSLKVPIKTLDDVGITCYTMEGWRGEKSESHPSMFSNEVSNLVDADQTLAYDSRSSFSIDVTRLFQDPKRLLPFSCTVQLYNKAMYERLIAQK